MENLNEQPRNWIFTFPINSTNKGKYAELFGMVFETREEMFRLFGQEWAFQYSSKEKAGVYKFNLVRMDLTSLSELDSRNRREKHV